MNQHILTLWLPWVLANAVAAGASVAVIWGAIHAGSSGSLPEGVAAAVWVSGLLFAAAGAAVGLAQWIVLRGLVSGGAWIAASALGLVAGTAAVGLSLNLLSGAAAPWSAVGWLVTGAAGGTGVGAGQWVVLRRQVEAAGWWVLASAAGASAGGLPYYLLTQGDARLAYITAGGIIAGAAYGAITGGALLLLNLRPPGQSRIDE